MGLAVWRTLEGTIYDWFNLLFTNISNSITHRAYTDRPHLTPLTPKLGLKTILMPSVIKGDYQNNRQWAKVSVN